MPQNEPLTMVDVPGKFNTPKHCLDVRDLVPQWTATFPFGQYSDSTVGGDPPTLTSSSSHPSRPFHQISFFCSRARVASAHWRIYLIISIADKLHSQGPEGGTERVNLDQGHWN